MVKRDGEQTALVDLLGTLGEKAPDGEAADFALLLRRRLSPSARLARITEIFIRAKYPRWYIRAVTDRHRNRAYRQAIEALVTPETVVIEAGTGSGLFAMFAARAGARHVYTSENDPQVAAIARENIARNGFADRITLHECPYEDLKIGDQLPCRGDLFLHEFVSAEFLVAKMAPMLGALRADILTPEAPILPQGFRSLGMLVGGTRFLDQIRVPAQVESLDVSGINLFASASLELPGPVAIEMPLSAPQTLAAYDMLTDASAAPAVREVSVRATADGTATGLLRWIAHDFPDGSAYENRPDLDCNWSPVFWPFDRAVTLRAGETVTLRVENTETQLFIDLAGNPQELA
jgi:type II protein arginine methyltransferase